MTNSVDRHEEEAPPDVAKAFIEAVMASAVSAKMTNRVHLLRLGSESAILTLGSLLGSKIGEEEERGFSAVHGAFLMERFALQNLSDALLRDFGISPAEASYELKGG